jgi:transposase InsO family protein
MVGKPKWMQDSDNSDNGKEYTNGRFQQFCDESGIEH